MWNDGPVSREEGGPDLSGMGTFVTNTHLGMWGHVGSGHMGGGNLPWWLDCFNLIQNLPAV